MINLREEASKIVGIRIEQGHWDDAFMQLNRIGGLDKHFLNLMILILKKLDEQESLQSPKQGL